MPLTVRRRRGPQQHDEPALPGGGTPEACPRQMARLGWAGGRKGRDAENMRVLARAGPFGRPDRQTSWAATPVALRLAESRSGWVWQGQHSVGPRRWRGDRSWALGEPY